MARYKFVPDSAGIRALMKSPEMEAVIKQYAEAVEARANASQSGYESSTIKGSTRVSARIHPTNASAYYDNQRNNTLLKALR